MFRSKLKSIILALAASLLALSLIAFPQESVAASVRGLNMWLEIVFPSLLPFFIVSEMLIGFGVVRFIGVLLEPFMRPLFRVPGAGGFVWAMGMASGFPAGAKLTARLRQEGQLTKIEAERLASFTNSSNPLFIFGAVSVGFFENAKLGIMLAAAHYLGNITVGFIMRFYGKDEIRKETNKKNISLRAALSALHKTRIEDNRPIGKLLGDAVMSSVQTLLMIGGFIILFSVLNQLLFLLHITPFFANTITFLFQLIRMPAELSIPFISGLFEITLGSQLISEAKDTALMQQAVLISLILGFSGLSVHAQVASILAQTDINFKPFFIARILQGGFAAVYTYILWQPLYTEVFDHEETPSAIPVSFLQNSTVQWADIGALFTICILAVYVMIYAKRMVWTKKY
ncbi:sporulation integral membrane protein YlbJ [Bacillus benzoevorans]|uniref:Sporulation integral membrane protein YlbJ n=1 Tax=Bacillus benzoevorans TaxID=1456 RepID=A0A7X0HN09_9BACI|nr:sporulation integral membrane protein YlbJ [Bacillus benzoevorans]